MFETFTVRRRSEGLVASLDADRVAQDADAGADPAGAGGGSQPSGDDAHFDAGAGTDGGDAGDGDRGRAAADDADDEDFEDDDAGDQNTPLEERVKKLAGALKKAKRKLGSSRGDRQVLKELRDRGVTLNDLYADARQYRTLMRQVEQNPRLRALLTGGSDTEDADTRRQPARRAANDTDDFTFDESPEALGFDPNDRSQPSNRVLANGLKDVARLKHQFERLLSHLKPEQLVERVNRLDQSFSQRQATEIRTEWNGATEAAAAQIKDRGLRTVFSDLMLFAREREGGKRPARFFVDHYLKQLGVNPADAKRASDAARADQRTNRVADKVTQLQRQNVGQNASPAPARKQRESVADVHKRIRHLAAR